MVGGLPSFTGVPGKVFKLVGRHYGRHYETSPQSFSTSGSRCGRVSPRHALRKSAGLSNATGAHCRWNFRWWPDRYSSASNRPVAFGTAWPAICNRGPARSRHQYRHRGRRSRVARRIHTARCRLDQHNQPRALSQPQFQFYTRHRDGRRTYSFGRSVGGESRCPDHFRPRADCLRKSQSRQTQPCLLWNRHDFARRRCPVQKRGRN